MKEKIILFDWDDTLFSKTEYKKNLRGNLARICEVTEEEIFGFEEKYFESLARSDDFQLSDFLQKFSQKFNKNIQSEDFNSDKLSIYSGAVFSDVISTLEFLKNEYRLGIYSQGFDSLQRLKIRLSGIESFFDEDLIYINRDKLNSEFVATLPDGAIIIEDKKEVVEILKAISKFDVVWINRKNDEGMTSVDTIKSLTEFVELIQSRAA